MKIETKAADSLGRIVMGKGVGFILVPVSGGAAFPVTAKPNGSDGAAFLVKDTSTYAIEPFNRLEVWGAAPGSSWEITVLESEREWREVSESLPPHGADVLLDITIAPNFNLAAASFAIINPDKSVQVLASGGFANGASFYGLGGPTWDVRKYSWVMLHADAGQNPGSTNMAPRMAGRVGSGLSTDEVVTDDTGGGISNGSSRQTSAIIMGQVGNSTAVQNFGTVNLQWKIQPVKSPFVSIALNWASAVNFQALATRVQLVGGW